MGAMSSGTDMYTAGLGGWQNTLSRKTRLGQRSVFAGGVLPIVEASGSLPDHCGGR